CCSAACAAEAATIRGRPNGAGDTKFYPGIICFSFPPLAASTSDLRPPKVVVSDRSQTLIVAQQTFRLLTHVQSIAGTTDETGHFLLLIRSNSSARPAYRRATKGGRFGLDGDRTYSAARYFGGSPEQPNAQS